MYRILAVLLVLLATACGPAATEHKNAPSEGNTGVSDRDIVLGSETDLSGDRAVQGADSIDGLRMRFDEVNAAGGVHGRHIRLIVDDTESKVSGAVSAVDRLIDQNGVFAVVLSLGIRTDNAVLPVEQKNDVPNMYPMSGMRSMVQPESSLKFTDRPTYDDEIAAGVHYFLGQGKHTLCVVYDDTAYGHEILGAAQGALASRGVKLALGYMQPVNETGFGGALDKVQGAGCEVVFLGTDTQNSVAMLLAAAKRKAFTARFVGTDADYGETFANLDGDAGDGLYAITPMARLYKEDAMPPKVRLWWNNYAEKYGDEPRLASMEGYRAGDLIVKALKAAGPNPTRAAFIKATEAITDYTDIFGYHLSFGPDKHQGTTTSVLSVLSHGKWRVVKQSLTAEDAGK